MRIQEDDLVTVKEEMIGEHHCRYHPCPNAKIVHYIQPGDVGIVAHAKVPNVRTEGCFEVVDFVQDNCTYRIRVHVDRLKRLKNAERPVVHKFCGVWFAGKGEGLCLEKVS